MIIGIDPGKSGAATILSQSGEVIDIIDFNKCTEREIVEGLREHSEEPFAYIEKLHSIRIAGKTPNFNLGYSYGGLCWTLLALKIPFERILPAFWQKKLGCLSKGDKKITRAKAGELFPNIVVTHNIADSLLIAEYGRRMRAESR